MGKGTFKGKVSCPACKSRDNVGVYLDPDGKYRADCFGCGQHYEDIDPMDPRFDYRQWDGVSEAMEKIPEGPTPYMQVYQYQKKETVEDVNTYQYARVPGRWDLEESQYFGVRMSIGNNGQPDAVYYPRYRDGKVASYKKRILETKQFSVIGGESNNELFGMQHVPDGVPCLILTEGEDDAGAARKMFRLWGKNYPVTSIPTGATVNADTGEGIIDKPLKRQLPRLAAAQVVYLCLDQDTPGHALARALADELAVHTEVKIMNMPLKDAREMENSGRREEFYHAFLNAVTYVPDQLIWAADIPEEEIMRPLNEGLVLPLPELQAKMHGVRYGPGTGELTLISGGPSVGKSSLLRWIQFSLLQQYQQLKIGTIYLEEQYTKSMQGMVAQYWKIPLPELRVNPNMLTLEQWREAKAFAGYRQCFMKHFGSIASGKLMNKLYHMHRMGIQIIALDHISMVVAGQHGSRGGERKDIDMLMQNLANFCVVTGCHVFAVVHLKRGDR